MISLGVIGTLVWCQGPFWGASSVSPRSRFIFFFFLFFFLEFIIIFLATFYFMASRTVCRALPSEASKERSRTNDVQSFSNASRSLISLT